MYRLYKREIWLAQNRNFGHARILTQLREEFEEVEMPEDSLQECFCFERNFDTHLPSKSDRGRYYGVYGWIKN